MRGTEPSRHCLSPAAGLEENRFIAFDSTADDLVPSDTNGLPDVFVHDRLGVFAGQILWGDVDCDGSVAIGDALKTARHLLGLAVSQAPGCPLFADLVEANDAARIWGDVDCDIIIAIGDALKVARHLLGLSIAQAAPCAPVGQEIWLN